MRLFITTLLTSVMLLSGCASSRTVSSGETRKVFGEYTVKSGAKWARGGFRNVEIWTVDGPQLQQLRLYDAMEDGDTLFEIAREALLIPPSFYEKKPQYHEEMTPHDVKEMVTSTLLQWGAVTAHSRNLQPTKLGGRDAFRFDLHFTSQGGLDYAGLVVGAINAEKQLHLILFMGDQAHYFPILKSEVDAIIASLRWR